MAIRFALIISGLPVIAAACSMQEDVADEDVLDPAAIEDELNAELAAQAAAGNVGAQQVLRGMEEFRRLVPEIADDHTASPEEREAALIAAIEAEKETGIEISATTCDTRWRRVRHGESGFYLWQTNEYSFTRIQPEHHQRWYSWFLFCRDPGWIWNHHAIWSNAGGYLTLTDSGWLDMTSQIRNPYELFDIQKLDSKWTYFRAVWGGYVAPNQPGVPDSLVFGDADNPLNGNALWEVFWL